MNMSSLQTAVKNNSLKVAQFRWKTSELATLAEMVHTKMSLFTPIYIFLNSLLLALINQNTSLVIHTKIILLALIR